MQLYLFHDEIAEYLLDTGNFPTDINQLTIEYSGNEVMCG